MTRNGLWAVVVGALIMSGCLATARAAPITPTPMTALIGPPVKFVSFWGKPFPFGYAYFPGQCYLHVRVETRKGWVWRRVWICTELGGRGYGEGGRY